MIGLALQGCGFENGMIVDPPINLQEFIDLPPLSICFVPKTQNENYPKE